MDQLVFTYCRFENIVEPPLSGHLFVRPLYWAVTSLLYVTQNWGNIPLISYFICPSIERPPPFIVKFL